MLAGIKRTWAKKSLVGDSCQPEDEVMFTVHCSGHGGRVLLDESAITSLVNGKDGIEMRWRCTCGTEGIELLGSLAGSVA